MVPVLLLQDNVPSGWINPPIGKSGQCDHNHLLTLRNCPNCPRFIVLSAPGSQSNLSQTSTWFYCGLAAQNQAANTPIENWLQDEFIEKLIAKGVERISNGEKDWVESAKTLAEESITSADAADESNGLRLAAWRVIARVWSINNVEGLHAQSLSLALGFPPPDQK